MTEQVPSDLRLYDAGQGYVFFTGKCHRCCGRGYHWGFGWNGLDPDWCLDCGGSGQTTVDVVTPWET